MFRKLCILLIFSKLKVSNYNSIDAVHIILGKKL